MPSFAAMQFIFSLLCFWHVLLCVRLNSSECQLLEWEKGVPNTVQCKGSDSWKWIVGNSVIDTTDKLRKKIYGYVPNGKGLSIFYPQENLTISCLAQGILNCYLIRLKGCQPQTCKNGGSCKIADPGTLQERIVCSCKYLSRGYRCEERYVSMNWVTILLWLAVIFEVSWIIGAIFRSENQHVYGSVLHRRFVEVINEPDELFL